MLSEKQKTTVLVVGFMGCVLLIMIGFFYFMLGRSQINRYQTESANLRNSKESKEAELIRIEARLSRQDEIEQQAEMVRKFTRRLPSSPDAPGFLNALVTILATTGIIQEEVKPANNTVRPVYTEIPYTIKAYGHYHEVGQFLTLIEQNRDRFMRVKHLKVSNDPERPSMHPLDMEVTTFMFNQ